MSRSANVLSIQTLKDFKISMINFARGGAQCARAASTWSCGGCATGWSATSSATGRCRSSGGQEEVMQARTDLHRRKITPAGQRRRLRHRAEGSAPRGDEAAPDRRGEGGDGQEADPAAPPRDRRVPLALAAAGRPPRRRVRKSLGRPGADDPVAGSLPARTTAPTAPRIEPVAAASGAGRPRPAASGRHPADGGRAPTPAATGTAAAAETNANPA